MATYLMLYGRLIIAIRDVCIFSKFHYFPRIVIIFGLIPLIVKGIEIAFQSAALDVIYNTAAFNNWCYNYTDKFSMFDEYLSNYKYNYKYNYFRTHYDCQNLWMLTKVFPGYKNLDEYLEFRRDRRYIGILSSAFFLCGSYKFFYLQILSLLKIFAVVETLILP